MAQIFQAPLAREFSNTGSIGAGYKYYFYTTGTTTPISTYTTPDLSVANVYPVVADSTGRFPPIWISNLATTKVILKDASDNVIYTQDPVGSSGQTTSLNDLDVRPNSYWGLTTGTDSAYVLTANPSISAYSNVQSFTFQAHIANGINPTMAVSGLGALNLKKYTGQGTKVALQNGDLQPSQRYEAFCDGVDIVVLNPEHPVNIPANTTIWRGLTYLPSLITISNNVSDANNDIDFSAGVFQFSDGSGQAVATAMTKRLDATWSAGAIQGGLDTGVKANSTWYYCYGIYNPTTLVSDFLFSASSSSPTLPSGFTKSGRLGNSAIATDGSGNIRQFIKTGNYTKYIASSGIVDYNVSSPSTVTNATQTITVPLLPNIVAEIKCNAVTGTSGSDIISGAFGGSLQTLPSVSATTNDFNGAGDADRFPIVVKLCPTSTSQIRFSIFTSAVSRGLTFATLGYFDFNA